MLEDMMEGIPKKDAPGTESAVQTVDGKAVGSPVRNVDADTLAIDGQRYRLEGFNAPETAKFQGGVFVPAQRAGDTTQQDVNRLAQLGGFNNLKPTGRRDPYGRMIAKQEDKLGNSLGDAAVALGITDPTVFSSLEAIGEKGYLQALTKIMPNLADADPILRAARESYEARIKANGGNPLYVPKLTMSDEAQYAAAKNMVGIAAVKEQISEIERLEGILKDPGLRPDTRAKLEKQREDAKDKLLMAGTTPDFAGSVLNRQSDRTIMNQAHDQFTTAVHNGLLDIKKGFYGYLEMAGDGNEWEYLSKKGREGVIQAKVAQGSLPDTLNSIRDINTNGDSWDVIKDSATYATNLIGGSLPLMGLIMGATMATGGLGAAALPASVLPSVMVYSGGFYADQPDDKKNPSLALGAGIGSAVLDRIGLHGIMGGASIFEEVGRREVLAAMVKSGKYGTVEQAEAVLKDATKKEIIALSTSGAEFAQRHYASREAALAGLRSVGVATAGESVTESGQTLLELFAVSGELDPDLRYEKHFYTALTDAAIGGAILGGGLNAGGVAIDVASWGSAANAMKAYEGELNDAQAFQAQQKALKEQGVGAGDPRGVTSVLEALAKVNAIVEDGSRTGLDEMEGKPGNWNGFLSVVRDPMRLMRGLADTTVRSLRKSNGELKFYSSILKSIMKPGILPGDHFDGFRQRIVGEWHTPDADTLATQLKTSKAEVNQMLKHGWQTAWAEGNRLGDSPNEVILQNWKDKVDRVSNEAKELLNELGYDTSGMSSLDSVFVDSAIDPVTIARNEERLVQSMVAAGASPRTAREAVSEMLSGDRVQMKSGRDTMERLGVFKDRGLNDLFEPNILEAFENHKHRIATDASQSIYFGKNGDTLAKLIHLAAQAREFATEREYRDTIQNAKDWYKIATGNYNSLEKYPFIEKLLGWGVTATMLASLGKATLSSMPEIAMSTMGTSGKNVGAQLGTAAKEFLNEYAAEFNKAVSAGTAKVGIAYGRNTPNGRAQGELRLLEERAETLDGDINATQEEYEKLAKDVKKFHKKYMGRSLFERLGFNDSGYNTQAKFETNTANMKRTMQVFSSLIGLNALTNASRVAVLSMAGDILNGRLTELLAVPKENRAAAVNTGVGISNSQYQALKEMQGWGLNVERTLDLLDYLRDSSREGLNDFLGEMAVAEHERLPVGQRDPAQEIAQELRDSLMSALRNMVDERISNPQTSNLPKYYHDPRFRVFTAMTRFIATQTANMLPRLYRDYLKEGNHGMRYQAFATMAMALLFAHLANGLKDILSYGDDESPYLRTNVKKAQRALYGSGIIGRYETAVDTAMPLYDTKKADPTKDPFTYAYQSVRNSAPPISWGDRAVRSMYELSTGQTESGTKKLVKSLPLAGSFPIVAGFAAEHVKE